MGPENYIELPKDGQAYHTINGQPVIIQAYRLGITLGVVAPISFMLRWRTVRAAGWKPVDHEAGVISEDEWKRLVAE